MFLSSKKRAKSPGRSRQTSYSLILCLSSLLACSRRDLSSPTVPNQEENSTQEDTRHGQKHSSQMSKTFDSHSSTFPEPSLSSPRARTELAVERHRTYNRVLRSSLDIPLSPLFRIASTTSLNLSRLSPMFRIRMVDLHSSHSIENFRADDTALLRDGGEPVV